LTPLGHLLEALKETGHLLGLEDALGWSVFFILKSSVGG